MNKKFQKVQVTKLQSYIQVSESPSYKVTKLQLIKMIKKEKENIKLFYFNKNNLNTCYYSEGDQHSTCPHSHYCIFNENRIRLDKDIHQLETELTQKQNDLHFIKTEGTPNSADYNATKNRIRILNKDLENLRKSRKNIIENEEVKGYGL